MIINDSIFEEIQVVDPQSFGDYRSEEQWSDEYSDILTELGERELIASCDRADYSEEDWYDMVFDEASNIIRVLRINQDGLLYQALMKWYGGRRENLLSNVRSAYDNYSEDGYLYYVTGIGYDTISNDLLGGTNDGDTTRQFLEYINSID